MDEDDSAQVEIEVYHNRCIQITMHRKLCIVHIFLCIFVPRLSDNILHPFNTVV